MEQNLSGFTLTLFALAGGLPTLIAAVLFFWGMRSTLHSILTRLEEIIDRDQSVDDKSEAWRQEHIKLTTTLDVLVATQREHNASILQEFRVMSQNNTAEHREIMRDLREHPN